MTNEEFWKDIIYKDGKIDEEQVMRELSDFSYVMEQVPKVYEEITSGQLSKISYSAKTILGVFNEHFWDKEIIKDDITAILEGKETDEEKLAEIKEYILL